MGTSTPRRTALLVHVTLVLALTGGLGAAVPCVRGLGGTEFQFERVALALLFTLALGPVALAARRSPIVLAIALAWPVSVVANMALGHDPIAAALNWRLRARDLCTQPCACWPGPGCLVGIENHEFVERWRLPLGEEAYFAVGPGRSVPAELRGPVGRALW